MNNLLQLKGRFESKKNPNRPGSPNIPKGQNLSINHVNELICQLKQCLVVWEKDTLIEGALIQVHYNKVIAKSNRIGGLFIADAKTTSNDSIRGSKFEGVEPNINHVFTHYISLDVLNETIKRMEICFHYITKNYSRIVSYSDICSLIEKKPYHNERLSFTNFLKILVDCYYVNKFSINNDVSDMNEQAIITIYKTKQKTIDLLSKIGISTIDSKIIDENTICLDPNQLKILQERAPYLIAMQVKDITKIVEEEIENINTKIVKIPKPNNEPIIGVIDTLFYEGVYFKDWVYYKRMVDVNIEADTTDCYHGTAVSSIIVDGPTINPDLDDGCGRFRVRHFGVATKGKFSSFTILKMIRYIVAKNPDIKVWNLSLGSVMQIHPYFISPEAAELDKIQCEYDVVFVVAGTNIPGNYSQKIPMKIGAPADSLNSLVVNSVDRHGNPASYHRVGPVLSFFHKPDISCFGGDINGKMKVCTPFGEGSVSGTSFAAPWISRKMGFLIYNMGFSREIAKALIIDSAAGWNRQDDLTHSIGYGIVPQNINDIIKSSNDEIRFIMNGVTDSYETYTYNIPVPTNLKGHPFYARATLCYYTRCSRNQGVDYTDTEMDIHFGRVNENEKGAEIKSINNNIQGNQGKNILYEGPARNLYRKWDNIKHISDNIKERKKAKKKYAAGLWGLSIKTKERLKKVHDKDLPFGVVITLKEMYGINRIDDFIKLCSFRGWIVNTISIDNQINVFNKAEEEIKLE